MNLKNLPVGRIVIGIIAATFMVQKYTTYHTVTFASAGDGGITVQQGPDVQGGIMGPLCCAESSLITVP